MPLNNGAARLKTFLDWFIRWVVSISVPVLFAFVLRTEVRMAEMKQFMDAGPRVASTHLEIAIASHERAMRREFIGREALDARFHRLEALLIPMQRDLERIRTDVEQLKRERQ